MFFTWKNLYKFYPEMEAAPLNVVTTQRNVGKTTDTYKHILEEGGFTPNKKVLLLRNTEKELNIMARDFNARFSNKFICSGGFIYSLEKTILVNKKTGEETEKYTKNELVGYMAAVSIYTNYKSVEAQNVKYIVYEEFNENTAIGRNCYPNFINLITTFIRFSKVKIFMLGNRDGFVSDFYINWNIIPQPQNITDTIYKIGDVGYWVEMGSQHFEDLNNNKTISHRLAMLDNRTAKYAEGGYLQNINNNVMNYKEILKNFSPLYYLMINEVRYIFGNFYIKGIKKYAVVSPWNFKNELDLKTYALDLVSRASRRAIIRDAEDLNDFATALLLLLKEAKIFVDSYDTLEQLKQFAIKANL